MNRLAVVAAAVTIGLAACGGGDGDALDDPLDLAREQVAAQAGAEADAATGPAGSDTPAEAPAPDAGGSIAGVATSVTELPAPDPLMFVGRHRVVNAWVGAAGSTQAVDVWARRTLTTGPVMLASGIGFGDATGYLGVPPGHEVVVVGAGAGPDGLALATLVAVADREQATTVITNHDAVGGIEAATFWEVDPDGSDATPAPPAEGTGLVVLRAVNTTTFETPLTLALGGAEFLVGSVGDEDCARQRIEDSGFAPVVLGRSRPVEIELAPGPHVLTLHPAAAGLGCDVPSVLDVAVDVVAGATTVVLVVSRDGASLEALPLAITTG